MNKNVFLLAITVLLLFSSCASRKNIVYLQDMHPDIPYLSDNRQETVIQPSDKLDITVNCKNPELAIPFNRTGGYQVSSEGDVSASTATMQEKGYRVDKDGNIQFPIFGTLHVQGLTLSQVSDTIKKKIIMGKYMQEPGVTVEFLNFRVYMLGAVAHCGPINVEGDHITLLEALSSAGDLMPKAMINRVSVIRNVNRTRQMYTMDLRSKDLFKSPAFNLRQNDIVYVEPRYRNNSREDSGFRYASFLLSIVTTISWIIYYVK